MVSSSTNISVINRPPSASTSVTAPATATTTILIPNQNNKDNSSNDNSNVNNSDNNNNNDNNIHTTTLNISSNKTSEPVRIESVYYLMNLLRDPLDIYSLLYVILKEVNSDVEEAYRRISKGESVTNPRFIFF